jgi:hypothetical protein
MTVYFIGENRTVLAGVEVGDVVWDIFGNSLPLAWVVDPVKAQQIIGVINLRLSCISINYKITSDIFASFF